MASQPFFGQSFFDFKVKMVSENIKIPSVTFLIPELTGNDTSFDFLCHATFSDFENGVGSHFGQPS